jgi:hypothetical protein
LDHVDQLFVAVAEYLGLVENIIDWLAVLSSRFARWWSMLAESASTNPDGATSRTHLKNSALLVTEVGTALLLANPNVSHVQEEWTAYCSQSRCCPSTTILAVGAGR